MDNSGIGTNSSLFLGNPDVQRNILVWIAPQCPDLNRLKQSAMIRVVDETSTGLLAEKNAIHLDHHLQAKAADKAIIIPGVDVVVSSSSAKNHQNDQDESPITAETTADSSSQSALLFLEKAMEEFLKNASASVATHDEVLRQVYCVVTDHPAAIEHFCENIQTYIDFNIHWIICETFENRASLRKFPSNRPSILQPTDVRHKAVGDEKVNRYNPSANRAAYFLVREQRGAVPTPNALDEIDKLLVGTNIVQYPPSVGKLFENITLLYKGPESVLFTGYTKTRKEKRVIRQFPRVSEEFMQVFTRLHQLSRSTSASHNVAAPIDVNEKEHFFTVEPHLCSFEKVHRHKAAPYAFVLRAFHTIICAFKSVHSLNCLFRWFGPQSIAFDRHQQMQVGISFCSTFERRNENTSFLLADYASPEALLDEEFSFAGDMWCVGASLFKMLTGSSLFENIDPKELKKYMSELRSNANEKPHVDVRDRINNQSVAPVSPEFITLIESLLSFDPEKRPTIEQIEELPFYPNTKEKIMALPQLDVDTAKEEYAKLDPSSSEFERIVKHIQAAQYKCSDRTFIISVESIETINNPVLRRMHEETRRKLAMAEHGGEMHNAVSLDSVDRKHLAEDKFAFYGVKAFKGQEGGKDSLSAKEVRGSIAQRGLLRVGHPKNPNQKHRGTTGIIGPNTEGVYLARFPVDAVRYSVPDDRPLDDNDCAEIIVFEVALGRCHKEWKSGMRFDDYKNKYDSFMDAKDVYLRDVDDQIHSTLAFPSFVVKIRVVRDEWYDPNEKTKYRISMSDEDILGRGGFGVVRRGMMLSGGKPVPIACKIYTSKKDNQEERERFIEFCKHEFEIMQNFRDYQSVAKVIDFKECRDGQVVLFMELLAMSLEEMIQKFDVLKPLTAARYFRQAASGLHALELEKYVHGDIKLHNLMLSHSGEVKLTDFGLAGEVGCNLHGLSWFYAAPELFFRKFSPEDKIVFLDLVNRSQQLSESSPDGGVIDSPLNDTNFNNNHNNNRSRSQSPSSSSASPCEVAVGLFPDRTGRDETAVGKNASGFLPPPQIHRDPEITNNNNDNFVHQQQRSSSGQARVPTTPGLHQQRHSYRPKKVYAPFTEESFIPSTVTHASDCYSLGVCLWRMLVKDPIPEDILHPPQRVRNVAPANDEGDSKPREKDKIRIPDMAYVLRREEFIKSRIPPNVAKKYPGIVQMIVRCLDFNPRNRPTFDEIRTQFNPHRDMHAAKHNTHSLLHSKSSPTSNSMTSSGSLLRASLLVATNGERLPSMTHHRNEVAMNLKNKSNNNGNDDDQFFETNHRRSDDGGMLFAPPSTSGGERISTDNDGVSLTGLNRTETDKHDSTTSDDDEVQFCEDHSGRANANINNNKNNNDNCSSRPPRHEPSTRLPHSERGEKSESSVRISVGMSAPTDYANDE